MFPVSLKRVQATEKIMLNRRLHRGSGKFSGDHGLDYFEHACCELTEPPRTNSPQGDLQARWFRTASCTGTSWGFEKGPSRSLFRFFAPLSSRRRKGNPLPSPGRRCDLQAVDNRLLTKGRWPFGLKCIKHAVVAQLP